MAQYLVRFDDINPRMDWDKFFVIKRLLEKKNIKSILGVVPNCEDYNLFVSRPKTNYYSYLRKCKSFGDTIAQHGYSHKYDSKFKGIFGSTTNSEFAGHTLKNQFRKLLKGKQLLEKELIWDPIFMAPNHSFDKRTLIALKKLGFNKVLDGFSLLPYRLKNLIFIPQISSKPLPKFIPCISQLCIHINTIKNEDLRNLMKFIEKNHSNFIALDEAYPITNRIDIIDRITVSLLVRIYRKIRRIIKIKNNIMIKLLCISQRLYYRFKLNHLDLNKWHLNGTYYCRQYKILSLEIINDLDPQLYIDIGCGLGELLSKVKLNNAYKIGFDKDPTLAKANSILHKNKFKYFSNEANLLKYLAELKLSNKKVKVISMLNFLHNISLKELKNIISKYKNQLGSYLLLIDNIEDKSIEYKYNHHEFLFNHTGLIKYLCKVDKLRSLYCIRIA